MTVLIGLVFGASSGLTFNTRIVKESRPGDNQPKLLMSADNIPTETVGVRTTELISSRIEGPPSIIIRPYPIESWGQLSTVFRYVSPFTAGLCDGGAFLTDLYVANARAILSAHGNGAGLPNLCIAGVFL